MTVYLLQSIPHPDQTYVGVTDSLPARLTAHNTGESPHTSKHCPWRIIVSVDFQDADRAFAFERYLKSGSGRAFAGRHLW
jgi:predicted GIY-YIG superfamily endonuclease